MKRGAMHILDDYATRHASNLLITLSCAVFWLHTRRCYVGVGNFENVFGKAKNMEFFCNFYMHEI